MMRGAMAKYSDYTEELADRICERLADGETLLAICRDDGMPSARQVRRWALDDVQGFGKRYSRAREIGYLEMGDEVLAVADDKAADTYIDTDGNRRPDHAAVQRSKLMVDTRKWLLSKCLPKIYGDRQTHEIEAGDRLAELIKKAAKLDG
jgi:hypothetical protein